MKKKIILELFRKYFKYSSPVDMYKNLNESINTERNKIQTESIKNALIDLKKDTENVPKVDVNKTGENNKIIDTVKLILYFNEKKSRRRWFKNTNTKPNA